MSVNRVFAPAAKPLCRHKLSMVLHGSAAVNAFRAAGKLSIVSYLAQQRASRAQTPG
jgi:hypothetical protein